MQKIFGSCNKKYYFGIIGRIWHNYSIHEQCNYGSLHLILSEVKLITFVSPEIVRKPMVFLYYFQGNRISYLIRLNLLNSHYNWNLLKCPLIYHCFYRSCNFKGLDISIEMLKILRSIFLSWPEKINLAIDASFHFRHRSQNL